MLGSKAVIFADICAVVSFATKKYLKAIQANAILVYVFRFLLQKILFAQVSIKSHSFSVPCVVFQRLSWFLSFSCRVHAIVRDKLSWNQKFVHFKRFFLTICGFLHQLLSCFCVATMSRSSTRRPTIAIMLDSSLNHGALQWNITKEKNRNSSRSHQGKDFRFENANNWKPQHRTTTFSSRSGVGR